MKALWYDKFRGPIELRELDGPTPSANGAVLRVEASGLCRSDWHGWQGSDPDIVLPHVPGHELVGVVVAAGPNVHGAAVGQRVTVPFCCGCGTCSQCMHGFPNVCDNHFQPGFTAWGSHAEYVAIDYADANLVPLPDELDSVTAAALGCRFATAYRAVVEQGGVREGQWVAVYGCGGVGLSAVMIAVAAGARVVAVDVNPAALQRARAMGASHVVLAKDAPDAVVEHTAGAHVSLDCLGRAETVRSSVMSLRKRGRHVQVGLLPASESLAGVPFERVVAFELELVGSHGIAASRYPEILRRVADGIYDLKDLVGETIALKEAPARLMALGEAQPVGMTVIDLTRAR